MDELEKDKIFNLCKYEQRRADKLHRLWQEAGGHCDTPAARNAAEQEAICFTLERLLRRLGILDEYKKYMKEGGENGSTSINGGRS